MQECQAGFAVERQLAETDFLTSSCGCHVQGTPDGGFLDSEGSLRLVQVVRVPLLPGMSADAVGNTLYGTVLAKIVKSQTWMRATGTLPRDFTIFCWLPPVGAFDVCLRESDALLWTEALLWNVRSGGWPFSLRVEVPRDPGRMFPLLFGGGGSLNVSKDYFSGLSFLLEPSDFEETDAEDEALEWYLFEDEFDENAENEDAAADAAYNAHAVALLINMVEGREPADEAGVQALAALLSIGAEELAEIHQAVLGLLYRHMYDGEYGGSQSGAFGGYDSSKNGEHDKYGGSHYDKYGEYDGSQSGFKYPDPAGPLRFAAREPPSKPRADVFVSPSGDAFRRAPPVGPPRRSRIQGLPWWGTGRQRDRAGSCGVGSSHVEGMMSPKASAIHLLASPAPCVC